MKTIEQRATEVYNSNEFSFVKEDIEELVRLGAEFAQRWIPVTEELPKEEIGGFSEIVLTKSEIGHITIERYDYEYKRFAGLRYGQEVAYWRPIELK